MGVELAEQGMESGEREEGAGRGWTGKMEYYSPTAGWTQKVMSTSALDRLEDEFIVRWDMLW